MKKGFTLIELLAVIVILAIIALIASPIVLNIINDARDNAAAETFNNIQESVKLYIAKGLLDQSIQTNFNGATNVIDELEYDGNHPEFGLVYVREDSTYGMALLLNDKCYVKGYANEKYYNTEPVDNECSIPGPYDIFTDKLVFDSTGIVNENYRLLNETEVNSMLPFMDEVYGTYEQNMTFINDGISLSKDSQWSSDGNNFYFYIPIRSGVQNITFDFDIEALGKSLGIRNICAIPGNATSMEELTCYINSNFEIKYVDQTEENAPKLLHLSYFYETNNQTSVILYINTSLEYGDYDNWDKAKSTIRNIEFTYGGLLNGNEQYVIPDETYVDNGLVTTAGTNIPNNPDIEITTNFSADSENGIYEYKYKLDTLSGVKEFNKKIYNGYEYWLEADWYVMVYFLPEGYTVNIDGNNLPTYSHPEGEPFGTTLGAGEYFASCMGFTGTVSIMHGATSVYEVPVDLPGVC